MSFDDWPYPKYIAHRGAGRLAPENTLAAMRLGISHGYSMFEFDAKLSRDGVPLLMHDATLDRTTDGHGRVADHEFALIARLDAGGWHSPAFAGERVPTLDSTLRYLAGQRALANVEIKPCAGRDAETGAGVARQAWQAWLASEGVRAGRSPMLQPQSQSQSQPQPQPQPQSPSLPPPLLSSFSEVALRSAREQAPQLPRALLLAEPGSDWEVRCGALDCVALVVASRSLTASLIARAHRVGLRVLTYTVNDAARARQLFGWGLDGLITDAVDRIGPV
ncbi:MAG: glycerophosphodiester phosphodiesterase family protein [Burkholderiaceae bacterium]